MDREFLEALGLEGAVIDKVMKAHGKAVNPLKADKERLEAENSTLKTDLKAAKDEIVTVTEKYETEAEARKKADAELTAEKTAHETYRNEVKAEKETVAKQKIFLDAVASFESEDTIAKLNPKQVPEYAKSYGGEVEWETLKDGSFKMKNFDAVMSDGMKNEAYDFKAPETRTAQTGSYFAGSNATTNPWLKESRNLGEQTRIYKEDPSRAVQLAAAAGIILKG